MSVICQIDWRKLFDLGYNKSFLTIAKNWEQYLYFLIFLRLLICVVKLPIYLYAYSSEKVAIVHAVPGQLSVLQFKKSFSGDTVK